MRTLPPLPPAARKSRRGLVTLMLAVLAVAATVGLWLLTSPRDERVAPGDEPDQSVAVPASPSPEPKAGTGEPLPGTEEPAGGITTPPLGTGEPPSAAEPPPGGSAFVPARLAEPLQPVYPREARGAGGTVRATVDVHIDENGEVVSADVPFLSSTTSMGRAYVLFKEAALKAVRNARFEPARRNGVAVADTARIVVEMQPPIP